MKKILLVIAASSLLFAVFSCGSSSGAATDSKTQAVVEEEEKSEEDTEVSYKDGNDGRSAMKTYKGIILDKRSDEGCEYIIQAEVNGVEQILVPLHLKEEFRVDGLKVSFSYSMSRRPTKCFIGATIILGSMEFAR